MGETLHFTYKGPFDFKSEEGKKWEQEIHTLFLNEKSIILQTTIKVPSPNSPERGFYYKKKRSTIFKMYENPHGDNYLKVYQSQDGFFLTQQFAEAKYNAFLSSAVSGVNDHWKDALCSHLSKLTGVQIPRSGKDGNREVLDSKILEAMYPFLRSQENLAFFEEFLMANKLHEYFFTGSTMNKQVLGVLSLNGSRGINQALRNSRTKEEFVASLLHKSLIKTEEDFEFISENLECLGFISNFNFRVPVSVAARKGYLNALKQLFIARNSLEMETLKFLAAHLPFEMVDELFKTFESRWAYRKSQHEVWREQRRDNSLIGENRTWLSANRLQDKLRAVPMKLRKEFSVKLWELMKEEMKQNADAYAFITENRHIRTSLAATTALIKESQLNPARPMKTSFNITECFNNAYVETCLSSSQLDVEKVFQAGVELFDTDFNGQLKEISYTITKEKEGKALVYKMLPDADRLLQRLVYGEMIGKPSNSRPNKKYKSFSASYFLSSQGRTFHPIVFPPDFEKDMRNAAAKIDKSLVRLGVEVTPANRALYLNSDSYMREFKVNWKYLLAGVPEKEVFHFRRAGIKGKKAIKEWVDNYNNLPEEMFRELLRDLGA